MNVSVEEKKIICPHCGSHNCFQEDHVVGENRVESYLCMSCGYTTTSMNEKDSEFVTSFEETCPELFKDMMYYDEPRNLCWYPTVLNFPENGLVFPDGTSVFDWKWRAVPVIAVKEEEKTKYPIPGKDGEYYEMKADMDNSKLFDQNQFMDACKYVGIIQTLEK